MTAPTPSESGEEFNFNPYEPLRRSGLVSFIPAERYPRIRFEPAWLQSALAHGVGWRVLAFSYLRAVMMCGALLILSFMVFWVQTKTARDERGG